MSRNVALVLIHLLGCLFFLALPYLFDDDGLARFAELPHNPHEQRNLLSHVLAITFFYLNYFVFIPRFYFPKRYVLYSFWVLVSFGMAWQMLSVVNRGLLTDTVGRLENPPPPPNPPGNGPPGPPGRFLGPKPPGLPPEGSQTFFLFLAGGLLSLAIRINNRWREAERRQLSTELSYLKAQINPHFLFNSLNSIYALAITESDQTAEAIARLSALMRYAIQDTNQPQVPLSGELDYISSYVALQRLRLGDTAAVEFTVNGSPTGLQIAPMLLISVIENAFKYGVNPSHDSYIRIGLTITGSELHSHVFNKKVRTPANVLTNGIGLSNTRARLELVYPGRHRLLIRDEPADYTVDLYLTLS